MAIVKNLVVEEKGSFIAKHQGRLQVKVKKKVVEQAPLMHLEELLIAGKAISLSSDAIMACVENGIPIHMMDELGNPYASLYSAGLTGTVQTRRAQLEAYRDERGVRVAIQMAMAKVRNQAALLRYRAKQYKEKNPTLYEQVRCLALEVEDPLTALEALAQSGSCVDEVRERLMGLEGSAARKYWQAVRLEVNVGPEWPGRKTRGATDLPNSLLNYGYGILYNQVQQAIVLAGLDPYAGFIHADRPGKFSLVMDLIEEFRQPAVDRAVFAMLNLNMAAKQDEQGLLVQQTREALRDKVYARLAAKEKYEGQQLCLRHVIQTQARHLARALRGEREYEGFRVSY